jgi:hypothetical protein
MTTNAPRKAELRRLPAVALVRKRTGSVRRLPQRKRRLGTKCRAE